ncbi:MAG: methyltransferase family protein [Elusimicrobiota bacterium]
MRKRIFITWLFAATLIYLLIFSTTAITNLVILESIEFTGFILMIIATIGRTWCGIYIAGRKNKELCVEGPYSLCRNPLYFFSFLGAMGVPLATQNVSLSLLVGIVFLTYYSFVIKSEEKILLGIFGDSFKKYLTTTPCFWINPKLFKNGNSILVEQKRIFPTITESMWFVWLILVVEGIEFIKEMILSGKFDSLPHILWPF